jgi:hypothetical protein
MLMGPLPPGIVSVRYIVGWREIPRLSLPKDEAMVLGMIVAIAAHYIEHNALSSRPSSRAVMRAHASFSHICESIKSSDGTLHKASLGHPCANESVPKVIG